MWRGDPHGATGAAGRGSVAAGGDQAEQTRQRILLAAAELFARRGYLGVNVAEVVAGLGLTKGAFYYFFASKDAVAREIVERHFALWRQVSADALAAVENRLDAVVEMSLRAAAMFRTNPVTRAGARLALEGEAMGLGMPTPFRGWFERVTAVLTEARERGELAAGVDPAAATELITAFFQGAVAVSADLDGYRRLEGRLQYFWSLLLPLLRPSASPA